MKIALVGKKNKEQQLLEKRKILSELQKEKALAYRATGDTWHDNPYFDMLRRDEEKLVKEINEMEDILRNAEIVENAESNEKIVNIGSKFKCIIRYSFNDECEEEIIEIVGHAETDLEEGKIAYDSLVGKNLMGHMEGDIVSFDVPASMDSYEIICFC